MGINLTEYVILSQIKDFNVKIVQVVNNMFLTFSSYLSLKSLYTYHMFKVHNDTENYLSKLQEMVKDSEAWHAAVHGVTKGQIRLSNWTITNVALGHSFLPTTVFPVLIIWPDSYKISYSSLVDRFSHFWLPTTCFDCSLWLCLDLLMWSYEAFSLSTLLQSLTSLSESSSKINSSVSCNVLYE